MLMSETEDLNNDIVCKSTHGITSGIAVLGIM